MASPIRWECEICTFLNYPMRPSCSMCLQDRPTNFTVPENYQPTVEERSFLCSGLSADESKKAIANEIRRINTKPTFCPFTLPVKFNEEPFDCCVCLVEIDVSEGLCLQQCMHKICKDCFISTVKNAPAAAKCQECGVEFYDSEIKSILAENDYKNYLQKLVSNAENKIPDSYHCQKPNCDYFVVIDPTVSAFRCQSCSSLNCIRCKAIHAPKTCKQYQSDVKNDKKNSETLATLEAAIKGGQAMRCPSCQMIVFKRTGCDWLQCSCLTELCWATKGPRWGPKGKNDTSGGCKCLLQVIDPKTKQRGEKCDPKCQNCH